MAAMCVRSVSETGINGDDRRRTISVCAGSGGRGIRTHEDGDTALAVFKTPEVRPRSDPPTPARPVLAGHNDLASRVVPAQRRRSTAGRVRSVSDARSTGDALGSASEAVPATGSRSPRRCSRPRTAPGRGLSGVYHRPGLAVTWASASAGSVAARAAASIPRAVSRSTLPWSTLLTPLIADGMPSGRGLPSTCPGPQPRPPTKSPTPSGSPAPGCARWRPAACWRAPGT
jgi:hypothetical protein